MDFLVFFFSPFLRAPDPRGMLRTERTFESDHEDTAVEGAEADSVGSAYDSEEWTGSSSSSDEDDAAAPAAAGSDVGARFMGIVRSTMRSAVSKKRKLLRVAPRIVRKLACSERAAYMLLGARPRRPALGCAVLTLLCAVRCRDE